MSNDTKSWIMLWLYLPSPMANMGKPPLPTFVLQLEEARAEWKRRHPPPLDVKIDALKA